MSSEQQQPKLRRSRKSIAVMPNSSAVSQSNNDGPTSLAGPRKKSIRESRSKSLGPGGLDALNGTANGRGLKDANGNGRRISSVAPQVQVKSILKPTLPLSPIQQIPAHRSRGALKQSSSMSSNLQPPPSANALLNFQPPPFPSNSVPTTVPIRTEEEQQRRSEILAARAARRQSLGNRRVSFAPEATLHTWDVVEYYRGDDGSSTPSSSVGSRASTPATSSKNKGTDLQPGVEATPTPAQAPEPQLPETPPSFRRKEADLPAQTPPMNFNNPDDEGSSSPFSSSPGVEVQSPFAGMPGGDDSSDSDGDSMDGGFGDETSGGRTFVSTADDTTMGDVGVAMDLADDEVTGAFKAFGKCTTWKLAGATETDEQPATREALADETEGLRGEMTMEMTRPVGGLLPSVSPLATTSVEPEDDCGDMAMDFTRPIGGILGKAKGLEGANRGSLGTHPQPLVQYDDETEEEEDMDVGMDITRPVGGILSSAPPKQSAPFGFEDQTMDMDITRPAGGILSALPKQSTPFEPEDQTMDMDITRPVGGILSALPKQSTPFEPEDQTMDMDITRPVGGILFGVLPKQSAPPEPEDQTMDMDITRPLGGIIASAQPRASSPTTSDVEENEEMTMEFTSVLGGIIGTNKPIENKQDTRRRRSSLGIKRGGGAVNAGDGGGDQVERLASLEEEEEATMDMTVAVGGILPSAPQPGSSAPEDPSSLHQTPPYIKKPGGGDEAEEDEDVDMEGVTMDITTAIGSILPASRPSFATEDNPTLPQTPKNNAVEYSIPVGPSVSILEKELEAVGVQESPIPAKRRTSKRLSAASSASGSEKRVTRQRSAAARKSLENAQSQSPVPPPVVEAPPDSQDTHKAESIKIQSVISVEERKVDFVFATPQKKRAVSQPRTPPEQLTPTVPLKKPRTPSKKTPVIETPLRAGGLNEGFSLSAKKRIGFPTSPSPMKHTTPINGSKAAGSDSPRSMKGIGINRPGLGSPRIAARLSGRKSIGEDMPSFSPIAIPRDLIKAAREDDMADIEEERREREKEAERRKSLDLRSRIEMLTPRKASRKSLAYGALLAGAGKRERSDDSETELGGGKRRKSLEESDTIGDASIATLPTPSSGGKQTPRKRVVVIAPDTPVAIKAPSPPPVQSEDDVEMELEDEIFEEESKLSLQQFLSMTSISFLDGLTTTKRRQTGFTGLKMGRKSVDEQAEASLTDCVIAGACTVPMLELFQYSSRELKKYIREGREVVKTIEADTLEENPLLFKEYISAPPDVKVIMDMQFKNVKTHARFVAKGIWYEWRTKLLDSVRTALEDNLKGLKDDEEVLAEARAAGDKILPGIMQRFESAKNRLDAMQEMKRRVESDDKDQLIAARARLQTVRGEIELAKSKLAARRKELESLDSQIAECEQQKEILQGCIEEAERVKEMNRGWSEEEVSGWKDKVTALEKHSGWSILSLKDGILELVFLKQLRLLWDSKGRQSPHVEYLSRVLSKPSDPIELTVVEQEFFTTALNARLKSMTTAKKAIQEADQFWRAALSISDQICKVKRWHPTEVSFSTTSGLALNVHANVLITEIRSKLRVLVHVDAQLGVTGGARVVYGGVNENVVDGFVAEGVKGVSWKGVIEEMVGRCLEGKRRGGVGVPTKM